MRAIIYFPLIVFLLVAYLPLFFIGWLLQLTVDKKGLFTKMIVIGYSKGVLVVNPWWNVEIRGAENYDKKKTYLILANHRSLYDIPLICVLPINMRWVAKYELYKAPVLGQMLFFKRDVMIRRGDPESTKNMMLKCFGFLKNGITMAMFPEGTRSKSGRVSEFKEGAFIVAKRGRVPILPIVIEGSWEIERKPRFGIFSRSTFVLNVLPEISVEKIKEMGVRELCDYTHGIIYNKHREVSPTLYESVGEEKK